MALETFKFLITMIIICFESIGAGDVTKIITGRHSYWGNCVTQDSIDYPRFYTRDEIMSDDRTSRPNFEETMNCKDNEWIVDWNADDLGKKRNKKNCLPVPSSHKNGDCSSCLCARDSTKTDCVDVDGYYWGLVETNIDNNQFMDGLRLSVYSTEIMFYYNYRTLLPNDEYDVTEQHFWGASRRSSYTTDCEHLSNNVRTIFLDDVILPAEYIVTGVRMAAIEEYEGYKGWKLQVKGTKYNSSFKLLNGTSQWFDYTNHANNDTSYDRERTEINVANTGATNRFVRFRGSTLKDEKKHIVLPYISDEAGDFDTPWGGVGLTYEGGSNFEGSLKVKAFRHGSYQFTSTTSTVPPTIENTITTTIEPPTTTPVEILIETTIRTTTDKPKIVPVIKLRTTTSTTEAPSFFSINVSTQTEPTIQPKVKRMRTHPVNISCGSKFETGSRQDEMADILGDLFIPIDNDQNSAPEFLSQFILILPLLFFILL